MREVPQFNLRGKACIVNGKERAFDGRVRVEEGFIVCRWIVFNGTRKNVRYEESDLRFTCEILSFVVT